MVGSDFNSTRSLSRIGLFCAVTLYPSWYFILGFLGIDVIDSMFERFAVISIGALFLVADFLIDRSRSATLEPLRRNWVSIFNLANIFQFCVVAIHYFYLTRLNQMHPVYAVGAFIIIFASCAVISDARALLFYSLEALALSIWASSSDTSYFRLYFIAAIATALLVGTLGTLNRIKIITSERETRRLLHEHQEKMITNSRLAAVGEMSGGIAHEINTPLATIVMSASLAREILATQSNHGLALTYLNMIDHTAKRIATIVKALLTFSRRDTHETFAQHHLYKLIEETIQICETRLHRENITLAVSCPPDLLVFCDKSSLGQALLNLLNNAVDATEHQSNRQITIEAKSDGIKTRVEVSDNGPGIPPEIAHKIFQPFFTTKEIGKGTGLGLSISRGLAESNHGTLTFTSTRNGAHFIISLPSVPILHHSESESV